MPTIGVRHLGDYIREQRHSAQISLRQLATLAGVSNPYLSQIERGLRKPSAEILQQLAKGLRISAEALYVQAGILEHREGAGPVTDAVLADDSLNERQKQVLLEIYESFRKENGQREPEPAASPVSPAGPAKTGPTKTGPTKPGPTGRAKATSRTPAAPRKRTPSAGGATHPAPSSAPAKTGPVTP